MAQDPLTPASLRYWAAVRASVSQIASTTQLWRDLFAFEQAQQIVRPTGLFAAVARMRSIAVAIREAAAAITRAGRDAWIEAAHIAPDIRARPLNQRTAHPIHLVRFEARVLSETGEDTRWLTYKHTGRFAMTKGQLMDLLHIQAPAIGIGSMEVVTGLTGRLEIVEV